MAGPAHDWLLVTVRGLPVLDACRKATAGGFTTYSPTLIEWRRRPRGRGKIWTVSAAYPAYAFVAGVDLAQLRRRFENWRVRPLVGEGSTWSADAVDQLRALEASWHAEARRPRLPRSPWAAGERIRVETGLFLGRKGAVETDTGGQLVNVALEDEGMAAGRIWRRATLPAVCLGAGVR